MNNNYVERVHSGKASVEMIEGEAKEFVLGMIEAKNIVYNELKAMPIFESKKADIITTMQKEIATEVIEGICLDLEKDICYTICNILDEQKEDDSDT